MAKLNGADLSYANLRDADLMVSSCEEASFYYADLSNACLMLASLQGVDLRHADLHSANLVNADLQRADLRWSNLRGADLSSIHDYGDDSAEVRFKGTLFLRATYDDTTIWPTGFDPREAGAVCVASEKASQ